MYLLNENFLSRCKMLHESTSAAINYRAAANAKYLRRFFIMWVELAIGAGFCVGRQFSSRI